MMTSSPFFQSQVPIKQTGMLPMPAGPTFTPGGGSGMSGMIQQLLQRIMAARGTAAPASSPVQPQQFGNGIFGQLLQRLSGRVAGGTGARGPDPSPFAGLAGLAGPFGNGGGPIAPNFASFGRANNKRFF